MLMAEMTQRAHVIVLGNEKGGSGKSTAAVHIIVALMRLGKTVGSIDLDSRQRSLTRYLENREQWAAKKTLLLERPDHRVLIMDDHPDRPSAERATEAMFVETLDD
jgi:chromosome partitioning protein